MFFFYNVNAFVNARTTNNSLENGKKLRGRNSSIFMHRVFSCNCFVQRVREVLSSYSFKNVAQLAMIRSCGKTRILVMRVPLGFSRPFVVL